MLTTWQTCVTMSIHIQKKMTVKLNLCATCVVNGVSFEWAFVTEETQIFQAFWHFRVSYESDLHFHSSTVCLLVHLSFSTGRLFILPAVFTVRTPHPNPPPALSILLFISPQTLTFSPGSSGEASNNYYVNKYACCNHIRATDPIRELIAGGWLRGLAADGQGLCVCLTGRPR